MVKATNFLRILKFHAENTRISGKLKIYSDWPLQNALLSRSKQLTFWELWIFMPKTLGFRGKLKIYSEWPLQNVLLSRQKQLTLWEFCFSCRTHSDFAENLKSTPTGRFKISLSFFWLADFRLTFPQNNFSDWKFKNQPFIFLVSRFSANFPPTSRCRLTMKKTVYYFFG